MFELEFEDPEVNTKYQEAVQTVKDRLGDLPEEDKISFLAIFTSVLKLQIEHPAFEKEQSVIKSIDLTKKLLERLKQDQPENFERVSLNSNEEHFKDGISTEVPKGEKEINYFLMLFATDLLADELEKKEKANI